MYWSIRREGARHVMLLVASYAFYMAWNPWLVLLIIGSTVLDFVVGLMLGRTEGEGRRKALLIVSLVGNLGVLGLFKYADFFIHSFGSLVEQFGFRADVRTLGLLLPVGISFYTFQTLSYTIDVYRRRIEPEGSFLRFALFVAFFPQLVAGPIVKARDFLPQLLAPRRFDWGSLDAGLMLILVGLTKKVLIADNLATLVDPVFAHPERYTTADLWLGMFCYAGQIYGDFSGYSDMAIGLAKLLGFELCLNFASPYLAVSLSDFWRRWHISLSSWLRDYLYIPLGGSHGTRWKTARNLMLTMLLGGLWHGASWTFVVWGAIHGIALVVQKAYGWLVGGEARRSSDGALARRHPLAVLPGWAATFLVVNVAWVFFRCQPVIDPDTGIMGSAIDAMRVATYYVMHLFVPASIEQPAWLMDKWPMCMLLAVLAGMQIHGEWVRRGRPGIRLPGILAGPAYAMWVLVIVVFHPQHAAPFIYFQF
ncbi:MAG: MBOAT family protein [Phycisphaerales bacterium]|nr:MBOAT family protein [Phycisphaerales bacterium]MCB9863621.1 MBOAT family protein [Phycisphaerales bacterium]